MLRSEGSALIWKLFLQFHDCIDDREDSFFYLSWQVTDANTCRFDDLALYEGQCGPEGGSTFQEEADISAPEPAEESTEDSALEPADEVTEEVGPEPAEEPATEPAEELAPEPAEPQSGVLTGLLVTDMSTLSGDYRGDTKPLGDTIVLVEYPDGFNIRAEVTDASVVQSVNFSTKGGLSKTEKHYTYDFFGTTGKWPNPPAGASILTVYAC